MSSPKAASKTAGGGSAIPAGGRKLISIVKEVTPGHTEEEIYAMLKDCNRDRNEAVARLLNEESSRFQSFFRKMVMINAAAKFHIVKRKREKKKETGTTKDAPDSRQGDSGNFGRGGRSIGTSGGGGPGRGISSLRTNSNAEGIDGRIKTAALKENGIPSFAKAPSTTLLPTSPPSPSPPPVQKTVSFTMSRISDVKYTYPSAY